MKQAIAAGLYPGMTNISKVLTTLLLSLSACVDVPDDGDSFDDTDELGSTDQAISALQLLTISDSVESPSSNPETAFQAAIGVNKACFLTGVGGNISRDNAGSSVSTSVGFDYVPVPRGLGGTWTMRAHAGTSSTTTYGQGECFTAPGLTPEVQLVVAAGDPTKRIKLADFSATRRCFFTKVKTTGLGAFRSTSDNVVIDHDANEWFVQASVAGATTISARCVNITQDLGTYWLYSLNEAISVEVPYSTDSSCLLTQISGRIDGGPSTEGPHTVTTALQIGGPLRRFFVVGGVPSTSVGGNGGRVTCVR
ncbi:MAG: hypothetical protein ACKV2T_27180 [Kofleriaceae bacterium]